MSTLWLIWICGAACFVLAWTFTLELTEMGL